MIKQDHIINESGVFDKDVEKTEADIKNIFDKSLNIMLMKNRQRGDHWRSVGIAGAYLEIKSMLFRLRNLLWVKGLQKANLADKRTKDYKLWKKDVLNCLEDLRNFTMLAELCILDENYYGEKYDTFL